MHALGVPFHEVQIGTSFHALGWRFDTMTMQIIVSRDKRTVARRLLRLWVLKETCSLRDLERLIGFLYWLTLAFFELLPLLGRFLQLKSEGLRRLASGARKSRARMKLSLSVCLRSDILLCQKLLLE